MVMPALQDELVRFRSCLKDRLGSSHKMEKGIRMMQACALWEIGGKNISWGSEIGRGLSSVVYEGNLSGTAVAIKAGPVARSQYGLIFAQVHPAARHAIRAPRAPSCSPVYFPRAHTRRG